MHGSNISMGLNPYIISTINRVVGIVVLLIGIGLVSGGGYWFYTQHEFIAGAVKTTAVVVEIKEVAYTSGKNGRGYVTTVRFNDKNGAVVDYTDKILANRPLSKAGDTVTVFYDPDNPRDVMIDQGNMIYLIPGVVLIFGLFFVLGGVQRLRVR